MNVRRLSVLYRDKQEPICATDYCWRCGSGPWRRRLRLATSRRLLTVEQTFGPSPTLPAPEHSWTPTVNIATADRLAGRRQARRRATGMAVNAFATGLDHPRWLYVLPNGDVLVAETNAPPKPEDGKGIKGWVMKHGDEAGRRRRAERRTASRCCATPTATASPRRSTRVPRGPEFAVRHGAGRRRLLRRQHRRGGALSLQGRRDADHRAPATKVADLPGGPINHHWTKNLIASRDGSQALRHRRLQQQRRRERHRRARTSRAAIWEIDRATGAAARLRLRPAQSERPGLGAADRRAVDRRSTSATSSAAISCPTT